MTAAASTDTLTPSEVVLLHGEQFAKKAMLGEKLLLSDIKVSAMELATTMIASAILANERRGLINLSLKKEKALFGLTTRESLKIITVGAGKATWPSDSTETALLAAIRGSEKNVRDAVGAMIGGTVMNPEHDYLARVKSSLADRGLLTREEKKILGLKVSYGYSASDAQRARISELGAGDTSSLIAEAKQNRPDVYNRLVKAIDLAFGDKTQSSGPD